MRSDLLHTLLSDHVLSPRSQDGLVVVKTWCLCCSPVRSTYMRAREHGHPNDLCHDCTLRALSDSGLFVKACGGRSPWLIIAHSQDALFAVAQFHSARSYGRLSGQIQASGVDIFDYCYERAFVWRGQLILRASVHGCWKVIARRAVVVPMASVERIVGADGAPFCPKVLAPKASGGVR